MNTHLPTDLEQFVKAKVKSGRFTSSDDAITEGLRLLRRRVEAEEARVLEGIRQGLDDMQAGRGRPADEVFADIRREFDLPPDTHDLPHYRRAYGRARDPGRRPLDDRKCLLHRRGTLVQRPILRKIDTLRRHPSRCPLAAEDDRFPEEIRELLYGRSGKRIHKHRIIFTLRDDAVHILFVRHTARDELGP